MSSIVSALDQNFKRKHHCGVRSSVSAPLSNIPNSFQPLSPGVKLLKLFCVLLFQQTAKVQKGDFRGLSLPQKLLLVNSNVSLSV